MRYFFIMMFILASDAVVANQYSSTGPATVPSSIPGVSGIPMSSSAAPPDSGNPFQEEDRLSQQRAEQALQQNPKFRKRNKIQTVCIDSDTKCLREEARSRINQNNGTKKDNPTDLNNRPSY